MPPILATVLYSALIVLLFRLDRERQARTTSALWLPVIWLWIVDSREVSQWLAIMGFGSIQYSDAPDQYLDGNPIDRAVYGLIILIGVIVLYQRGTQVRRLVRANTPILMFYAYCALSIVWSDYSFVALKRWTKAIGDLVMILIVLTEPNWPTAFRRVLSRQGYLLIPLSVLFIKYYPNLAREYKMWSGKANYTGVTTTKNLLGMLCLMVGLGFVARFISCYRDRQDPRRTKKLVAQGILLIMAIWLFWMSNSMTSLACFMMGTAVIVLTGMQSFRRHRILVHILVATTICASFSVLFLGIGGGALEQMGRDRTLTGRTGIWDLVLSIAGNPFLGTGFESFWLGWRLERVWEVMKGIQEAHNGYLEIYLNLGWIGCGLLGAIIVSGYRKILAAYRLDPDTYGIWLTYFVIGIIYSFTEAGFRMMFPVWIFFLMAIMAVDAGSPALAEASDSKGVTKLNRRRRFSRVPEPHLPGARA